MSEETKQHPGCGRSYVVCGAAGGQGTTLVAELLYEALREGGTPAKLAGVHFTEDECRSHIAMLYPEALDVKISLMAVRENGLTLLGQMDEIDDVMAAADPAVIDLGSGFADLFSIWARETCGTHRACAERIAGRVRGYAFVQDAMRRLGARRDSIGRPRHVRPDVDQPRLVDRRTAPQRCGSGGGGRLGRCRADARLRYDARLDFALDRRVACSRSWPRLRRQLFRGS